MRILFVSHETGYSFGVYLDNATRALAERGHDVHVLSCSPFRNAAIGDERRDGVWVHRRRCPPYRTVRRASRVPVARQLLHLLRTPEFPPWISPTVRCKVALANYVEYRRLGIDFDVIEAPDHLAEGLVLALAGVAPVVVELHGTLGTMARLSGYRRSWHLEVSAFLERLAARAATMLVAPSRFAASAALGFDAARRARVVPHTIDADRWACVPDAASTEPVILNVGAIGTRRGCDVLVRAAAKLVGEVPDLEVCFVGSSDRLADGTDGSALVRRLGEELGVRVRIVDHVSRDALTDWYGRARVFAVPSRFDTFSQVTLEAMAARRPVVCSDATGVGELASRSGGSLTVIPNEDADALAAALERPLKDPLHAVTLGERARVFVAEVCGPAHVAARREALYLEAVAQWKRRRLRLRLAPGPRHAPR